MREIGYGDAVNEAMLQEMERDSSVFVYGLDVSDHKRIFGTTKNLVEKFGEDRCFITPLSEDAMTGVGLGAAINGLRPIHIHVRVDFFILAMNQIMNMISNFRYMSGGKVKIPLVIRAIVGRGWGQSAQHSKSLYSIFAHIPGIKVVLPTTPYDAKGMIISAIRDDNPVIFIEHRWLYYINDFVPEEPYTVSLGKPSILHQGDDITIVATSWMNVEALKAAEILNKNDISVEVIDPRTIQPFDDKIVIDSVKKTGRCIVADNDWLNCGFSAEVAARVSQKCFNDLIIPVERIGFAEAPCPTTRPLENQFYPNAIDIIKKVEKVLKLDKIDLSGEEFYSYENRFKGPF